MAWIVNSVDRPYTPYDWESNEVISEERLETIERAISQVDNEVVDARGNKNSLINRFSSIDNEIDNIKNDIDEIDEVNNIIEEQLNNSTYIDLSYNNIQDDSLIENIEIQTSTILRKDGTEESFNGYKIASFSVQQDKIYRILCNTGSQYSNLCSIELIKDNNIIAAINPIENARINYYLHDFTGDVKVCYRDAGTQTTDFVVFSQKKTNDNFSQNILGIVDYGYDIDFFKESSTTETQWNKALGIEKSGFIFTLNKTLITGAINYVRINGTIQEVASSGLTSLINGLFLIKNHNYCLQIKLLGGESLDRNGESKYIPEVHVFKEGNSTNLISKTVNGNNIKKEYFSAPNSKINMCLQIGKEPIFEDAKFLITLQDLDSEFIYKTLENRSDYLPNYYFENNYLDNKINTILAHQQTLNAKSESFIFFTDPHFYRNSVENVENGMMTVPLIKYIQNKTGIRKVVCGGDLANGNTMTKTECFKLYSVILNYLSPIWDDLYMIIGNHEWNNPDNNQAANQLTLGPIYNTFISSKENQFSDADINDNNSVGSYTIDNPIKKIRTIYIGTSTTASLKVSALQWIAKQIYDIPDNYNLIIISHTGLTVEENTSNESDNYISQFKEVVKMLNAAKLKTTYTLTVSERDYGTWDYSNFNGNIIGVFSGHNHSDRSLLTENTNIPIISTTSDAGPDGNLGKSGFPAARAYGTINEQAIDVIQIDMNTRNIYMTRIGGSYNKDIGGPLQNPDRTFTF